MASKKKTNPYDIDIRSLVRDGLEEWRGHWPFIATKAGVAYSTITQMMQERHPNPRFDTIEAILGVLSKLHTGELEPA